MKWNARLLTLCIVVAAISCNHYKEIPVQTRTEKGAVVHDNYLWLSEDSERLQTWLAGQERRFETVASGCSEAATFASRLQALADAGSFSVEIRAGEEAFFLQKQGLPVLFGRRLSDGVEHEIANPNAADWPLSERPYITSYYPSPTGKQIVITAGALYVADALKRHAFGDTIPATLSPIPYDKPPIQAWRANRLEWNAEGDGFWYSRARAENDTQNFGVFFHRIGTSWSEDTLVLGQDFPALAVPMRVERDPGNQYLIITVRRFDQRNTTNDIYVGRVARLEEGFQKLPIQDGTDCYPKALRSELILSVLSSGQDHAIATLRYDKLDTPSPLWPILMTANDGEAIEDFTAVGKWIIVHSIEDVRSKLQVFDLAGRRVASNLVDDASWVLQMRPDPAHASVLFGQTSYFKPHHVMEYDLVARRLTTVRADTSVGIDPGSFSVKQEWFESAGGVKVPMYIITKRTSSSAPRPTLLFGYGGFNQVIMPSFSPFFLSLLERGWICAIVNARGGAEFPGWYEAGKHEGRRNTIADFIGAGEHLISRQYTTPELLFLYGKSYGGTNVLTAGFMRPDVFGGAVFARVPLTDLEQFHNLRGAVFKGYIGDPGNPADLKYLSELSPLNLVRRGVRYPPIVVTASSEDKYVHPYHGYAMVEALQSANPQLGGPFLLMANDGYGHAGGSAEAEAATEGTLLAMLTTFVHQ